MLRTLPIGESPLTEHLIYYTASQKAWLPCSDFIPANLDIAKIEEMLSLQPISDDILYFQFSCIIIHFGLHIMFIRMHFSCRILSVSNSYTVCTGVLNYYTVLVYAEVKESSLDLFMRAVNGTMPYMRVQLILVVLHGI